MKSKDEQTKEAVEAGKREKERAEAATAKTEQLEAQRASEQAERERLAAPPGSVGPSPALRAQEREEALRVAEEQRLAHEERTAPLRPMTAEEMSQFRAQGPDNSFLEREALADALDAPDDLERVGNPDLWELYIRVGSEKDGWRKSTYRMKLQNGYLYQVEHLQDDRALTVALCFVPN